ncbi:helix-turn-helix domain-containing protein [Paenibacillus alvei]|nr:helix-turn-helix domain-containing protein [Paenibacillus alvei]
MFNQKALENIMTVEEAAEEWGLAPGTVKNYCAQGKVQAKKVGRDWAIDRNQPNPRQKA